MVDPSLMNQVFNNLLKNAIESIDAAIKTGILKSQKQNIFDKNMLKTPLHKNKTLEGNVQEIRTMIFDEPQQQNYLKANNSSTKHD